MFNLEVINKYRGMLRNFLCVLFILTLSNSTTIVSILPTSWDECGYLAQAKLLAGSNWADVISQMPYYSYGTGVLPSLIMRLQFPYYIEYRILLLINSLIIVSMFFLTIYLIKNLYESLSEKMISILALIIVCYPSNIAFSNYLLSENYLTFFFLLACVCIVNYIKAGRYYYLIGCSAIVSFMYYVHNRAIAVVVAVILFNLIVLLYRKNRKERIVICCSLFILAAIFMVGYIYKVDSQNTLWTVKNELSSVNDIEQISSTSIVNGLLDVRVLGVRTIFAAGKLWYLLVATFGIVAVGIYYTFKEALLFIKGHISVKSGVCLFALLSFVGTCGAFWALISDGDRVDHIIIGRYLDYMVGPLLLVGLCEMHNANFKLIRRILLSSTFIIIFIGKIIEKTAESFIIMGRTKFDRSSNAEWFFLWDDYYKKGTFMLISVLSVIIILLSISVFRNSKLLILILFLSFNIITIVTYNNMVVAAQRNNNYPLKKMVEKIEPGEVIGYFPVNTGIIKVQYMMSSNRCKPIYNEKEVKPSEFDYIYTDKPLKDVSNILDNYQLIYESNAGCLYRCSEE